MRMINFFLILTGKILSLISRTLNLGHGSTWPGHAALSINKSFIKDILKNSRTKIVLIAGTNGKTTTGKLIRTILEENQTTVFQNESGANLLNGIASSIILHSSILCELKYNYAIFEVDENSVPLVLQELTPHYVILLNLFRDQLDRYGEVNTIAQKWGRAIQKLPSHTTFLLNADDPQIAYLGEGHEKKVFFGLLSSQMPHKSVQHAADSIHCPKCQSKLAYRALAYSHVGEWYCPKCRLNRPKLDIDSSPLFPLEGTYNKYNTLAAVLFAQINNIDNVIIKQSLNQFKPAFGRQEVIKVNNKSVQLFLSKNPTSFNESLKTAIEKGGKHFLFVLNDRIPDGQDVSWIWDVDFEDYIHESMTVTISGDRTYDMALRMKYSDKIHDSRSMIQENLEKAINQAIDQLNNDTLYILPTYSAMLETRKILTGKKIL